MSSADDGGEQVPVLDDVLDMEPDADEEQRWVVLFDEDYDDVILDAGDSVVLLVDCDQACELLRLASKTVFALAPEHAPDREPVDVMIERLEEVRDDG